MLFFEQISGSDVHKKEYNELKTASRDAEKEAIDVHNRRKLISKELKLAQKDKHEAKKFDDKKEEHHQAKLQQFLWEIFYNKEQREEITDNMKIEQDKLLEVTQSVMEVATKLSNDKKNYHALRLTESKAEKALTKAQDELGKKREKNQRKKKQRIPILLFCLFLFVVCLLCFFHKNESQRSEKQYLLVFIVVFIVVLKFEN